MSKTWNRALWPLVVFVVVLVVLAAGLRRDPAVLDTPLLDKPLPQFQLPQLQDGEAAFGPQQLLGKVWVLNVWASWCAPCRAEMPALQTLARQSGVPVIGLNHMDTRDSSIRWLEKNGNPFQHVLRDDAGKVGLDLGVVGVPETFVVDRNGTIRYKLSGELTEETLRTIILPLIQKLEHA